MLRTLCAWYKFVWEYGIRVTSQAISSLVTMEWSSKQKLEEIKSWEKLHITKISQRTIFKFNMNAKDLRDWVERGLHKHYFQKDELISKQNKLGFNERKVKITPPLLCNSSRFFAESPSSKHELMTSSSKSQLLPQDSCVQVIQIFVSFVLVVGSRGKTRWQTRTAGVTDRCRHQGEE